MRTVLLIISVALFFGSSMAGCSTIKVYSDDSLTPGPYVGTKHAIKNTQRHWQHYDYYGQVFVYATDVPLCLIADTVLLPYAIYTYNALDP